MAAIVPGVLLIGVLRRWHWARTWTVVTLGLGAIMAAPGVFVAPTWPQRITGALAAVVWGWSAVVLERSAAIDAYYDAEPDARDRSRRGRAGRSTA